MMPQAATATLPGSPAGSPVGPGSSPMAAPGAGEGNIAAAMASLKGIFPMFYKLLSALPVGSEEWKAVSDAVKSLGKIVGKTQEDSLVPAAIQKMAMAAKGGPLKAAPPIGIQPNIKPAEEPEPV